MSRIGFIDYYLDEFHANKYPGWIQQYTGGTMEVSCAYAVKDYENGMSNEAWSRKHGIPLVDSIEEVVDRCDYFIVLSPDNPEHHEALSELPLQSGKPTFIDKTFAPDRATALRLFELAEKHGTPMFSTSALRFASEYTALQKENIQVISSWGPGKYGNYAIHQLEPIVSMVGTRPLRLMSTGTEASPSILIEFEDGRRATIQHFGWECPFVMNVLDRSGSSKLIQVKSDFWSVFIRELVQFFQTGVPPVHSKETITVITLIEYGLQAQKTPDQWISLP